MNPTTACGRSAGRAVHAVRHHGLDGPVDRWRSLRRGLDGALLLVPRVGFLPWSDPRVVGTIEAIERGLSVDGFVLRYHPQEDGNVDGLPGREGAFLACTFWLVDALHGIGRGRDARDLFERLLDVRNDLGLLSEEYDTHLARQLGNTPQACSHVGLVNSARHLSGGPDRAPRFPPRNRTSATMRPELEEVTHEAPVGAGAP